jgi:hypothetical protein
MLWRFRSARNAAEVLEKANQKEVALSSVRCGLVVKTVYVLLHVARQALSSGRLIGLDFFLLLSGCFAKLPGMPLQLPHWSSEECKLVNFSPAPGPWTGARSSDWMQFSVETYMESALLWDWRIDSHRLQYGGRQNNVTANLLEIGAFALKFLVAHTLSQDMTVVKAIEAHGANAKEPKRRGTKLKLPTTPGARSR